jgi:hypothetical protein
MNLRQTNDRVRELLQRQLDHGIMSNKLLSLKTTIGQSHLSNFQQGRRRLSVEALSRVISALGLELELVPRKPEPQGTPKS